MSKPARILLIEDSETNREFFSYLLRALGYDLIVAEDGVAGVEAAIAESPDLVLCDIQMPQLDGFGVLRQLTNNPTTRHIPVVALTALAMVSQRDEALSAGFVGYIDKPVDPERVGSVIESFLAHRQDPIMVPG